MSTLTQEKPVANTKKWHNSFRIYKPNNKDHTKGCASTWEWDPNEGNCFLTIAKQSQNKNEAGNAVFDWKTNFQIFKLDEWDLGEIVAVLSGRKNFLGNEDTGENKEIQKGKGLFHQTSKSRNTILKIYKIKNSDDYGLELSASKDGVRFWAGHRIALKEAITLSLVLEDIIKRIFYFNKSN